MVHTNSCFLHAIYRTTHTIHIHPLLQYLEYQYPYRFFNDKTVSQSLLALHSHILMGMQGFTGCSLSACNKQNTTHLFMLVTLFSGKVYQGPLHAIV